MLSRTWAVARSVPRRSQSLVSRHKYSTFPSANDIEGAIRRNPFKHADPPYQNVNPIDLTKNTFQTWITTHSVSDAVGRLKTQLGATIDTDTYNSLFEGLTSAQAQELFDLVFRHKEHEADMNTYTQLMCAYIRDGHVDDGMGIYHELRDHAATLSKSNKLTLGSEVFDTLITALTEVPQQPFQREEEIVGFMVDDGEDMLVNEASQPELLAALNLLHDMRRLGLATSNKTYTALLDACARAHDEYVLEQTHRLLRVDVHASPDDAVQTSLANAYRQVGDESTARQIMETR